MSIRWRGGNWTAGNWDANNWLGPNVPPPPGSMSGSVTITISTSGALSAANSGFISGSTSLSLAARGALSNGGVVVTPVQTPFGGPNRYDLEAKQRDALARRIAAEDMNDILLVLSAIAPLLDDERMAA